VKRHLCPSCQRPYVCTRGEAECGSPYRYDCYTCYLARHQKELEVLLNAAHEKFGARGPCAGFGGLCHAH